MKKWIGLILLGGLLLPSISPAIDLKQSKFTQVVNNVEIISAADKTRHAAAVNDVFSMPDVLRTGPDSRAELDAVDGTITRVGANTIFSFDPLNRTIDLQQGSLLFHSPKGKGGGTIRTGSATASVIGTTIIITATPNGGFKLLDLEGQAEVRFLNGINQTLEPGQMTFILPSGATSPILVFRLDSETKGSKLVSGFNTPLDSQSKIDSEITQQLLQILNGTAADTGLLVGNFATINSVQVVQDINNKPTSLPDGSIVGNDRVSTLPVNYPQLDPSHVHTTPFTPPPGVESFSEGLLFLGIFNPASGFVGNNIDIDTAKVDLSSYAGSSDFDIMAAKDLRIWQSVNFDKVISPTPSLTADISPQLPDVVSLIAGGQMLIASGSTLEADTGTFGLVADSFGVLDTDTGLVGGGGQNILQDVTLINNAGDVDVLSLSDFTFASGSINGGSDGSELSTGGEVEIQSDGTLTLGSETTVAPREVNYQPYNFTIDSGGDVALVSSHQMNILDSQIDANAGNIGAVAGGGIYIYGSDINAFGQIPIIPISIAANGSILTPVGGDLNISGGGEVGIYSHSMIDASGGLNITSGDASSGGGDLNIENSTVYAGYVPDFSSFGGSMDLNAENGAVYISGSVLTAHEQGTVGGNVTIDGAGVQIYSTSINGGAGVDIASSGALTVGTDPAFDVTITAGSDATLSAVGSVDMTDTGIYADYGAVSISAGGNVYLSSSDIESGYDTSTAYDLGINAGGTIDLEDTYVYATGDVDIESGDTLTLGYDSSDEIDANGFITLKSDNSDVYVDYDLYAGGDVNITSGGTSAGGNIDVEDSDIYAGYGSDISGSVNISAAGSVYLSDSDIYAGYDSEIGDVNIRSYGSTVDVEDSDIYAAGDLNIESSDTLTVEDGSYLEAYNGDVSLISDNADVDITDSDIYSDNGNVNITGGGDVTIENSTTIAANNGLVDIESGGTLTVGMNLVSVSEVATYDTAITAGTEVTLSAVGSVDMTDTGITAGNDVSITGDGSSSFVSPGNLSISQTYSADNIDITGSSITSDNGDVSIVNSGGFTISGTTVSISDSDISLDNISISGSTITADNGGVLIEYDGYLNRSDSTSFTISGSALNANDIFISGSSITANSGDVDIWDYKNEDNAGPDSVTEDSDVYTSDISITSDSTITANNGNVDIKTENGGIDLENSTVYADDCIRLCADAGVTIYNDTITAGEGVKIHSGSDSNNSFDGNMYLSGDTITAGTDATISGDGNVAIDGSTIKAVSGLVDIESGGTLTLGQNSSGTIEAAGNVNLTSDNADVDSYGYDVYADNGGVNINAAGNVYLSSSDIESGYNSGTYDVNITATSTSGNVDIEGTYVSASGDVNIGSGGTLTLGSGDTISELGGPSRISINAGGVVNLTSDNADVDSYDYAIYANGSDDSGNGINVSAGGNVDIEDSSEIYAENGGVKIAAVGGVYLYDDDIYASWESGAGGMSIVSSGGTVDIDDTYLDAEGDVNIESSDTLTVEDSSEIDSYGLNGISLTSENADVDVNDSEFYAYSGSVNIGAAFNVDIENSDIYAYDNVNINSSTGYAPDAFNPVPGSVDIEYSHIYAGYNISSDEISFSTDGGSVNINAWNGDADLYDDEIYAYSGAISDGDVNIYASGSVDLEDVYDLYADATVNIEGYNTVTVEDGSDLEAKYGNVSLTSDNADVDITDSEVYSDYGNVNVSAAGSVYVSDGDIRAGYDSDTIGDVNIHASSGTADFENTDIGAAGGIYIESSGTLTLNYTAPNDDDSGYHEVYAESGPVKLKSDYGNVDIYSYDVYAEGGDLDINAGGGPALNCSGNTGGNVDIENSTFGVSGAVNVTATGNVYVDNSYFDMYDGGNINVNAGGNIDDLYTGGYGSGSISMTAGGYVNVDDSANSDLSINPDLYVSSWNVTAGSYVDLTADASLQIANSTIAANGGDVDITGNSAGVDIDATAITSTGDINITAGGGYHVDSLSSGGHVASSHVAPSYADSRGRQFSPADAGHVKPLDGVATIEGDTTLIGASGVDISGSTITADNGDVSIYAGGGVDIIGGGFYVTIDTLTSGDVNIVARGDINISDTDIEATSVIGAALGNATIFSDNGNVDIESSTINAVGLVDIEAGYDDALAGSETLTLNNDTITAGTSITANTPGAVSVSGSSITANGGDVDIQSSGSTVDIENTYIYANGNVNIESSDTLTLGYTGGNTIEAYDGDVSLTSDNADVDAYSYSIYSYYGNVNISAGGSVYLSGDDIYSGYYTDAGNVNIQSLTSSVDIEDTYISAAGNVGIISYGALTLGNTSGNEIYADGWVNLSSTTGDVDINGYSIYSYGSDVDGNGLTISAAVGSLNFSGDSFYAYDNGGVNMSALGAGSTVDFDGTYLDAEGDVNIEGSGTLTVENSSTIESYGDTGISLKSDISAVDLNDSSLYAYNGDVNITAPGASGTIDIEDTYISAIGNVNIESSGTLTLGSLSAWTIDAGNAISLKSDNADVDINTDYELDADGSDVNGNGISISAGGSVDIENDYDIYADYGGVKIAAAGTVYLYNDDIYTGYDDTGYGDINIVSSGSTVDVDDTYLDAEGDVNIEGSGTLTVENSSEIDSYGNNGISLTSDKADVDVSDSSLYAYYGDVNITAIATSAEINLQGDYITAYGNVNIESDSTLTLGNNETGGDTIYAGSGIYLSSNNGDVDVNNSFLYGGFDGTVDDINIHDGSTITADGSVNLNAYGATVSIYAPNGNIYIGHTTINPGGGIDISDASITAGAGEGGVGGVSIYSDGNFYVGGRSDTLFYDDIEGNNISISGSSIFANNGGISIVNDAYASTADAVGFNVDYSTLIYGDINISAGSTITADNGSVDIQTASLELFNDSSAYGSDISLNDISIYDSTITANGGNVTVSAGGLLTTGTKIVSINKSDIAAALPVPYGVSINASGYISLYGYSGANLDYTTAEAGGEFDLESDHYVNVYNSSLTADTGDLHIYGDYGNVDLENSIIKATLGNVDIEAGYDDFQYDYDNETLTLYGDTITAGGSVTLKAPGGVGILNVSTVGMTIDDSGITAGSISLLTHYHAIDLDVNDFGSSVLTAGTGDADIYADNGDVDVQGSTIKATLGNVNIGAGFADVNNYNVEQLTLNGVTIKAGEAASLTSSGGIHVDDSGISAASMTLETLYGVADVDVNDSGSSTLTAGAGDADVYADNGNVDVEGSTISATATLGNVNIGAGYKDGSDLNSETLTLNGGSISAGDAVTLTAQSDVDVNQDSSDTTTMTAGTGDVDVTSYHGNVDVENATVTAGDSVSLTAPGTVTLTGGSVTGNNNVNVTAGTGITINGTPVSADDTTYGNITLTSTAGQTTIQNGASMTAYNLTINSAGGILIDGSHGGTFSGRTLNLTAGGGNILGGPVIGVNNEDFSGFQAVNMSSYTINLSYVDFGSSHTILHTFLGVLAPLPDTGAISVPGEVNFINGVTIRGTLINAGNVANYINNGTGFTIAGL